MKINRLREIIREEISEMLTLGGDTSSLSSEKHYLDYTKDELDKIIFNDDDSTIFQSIDNKSNKIASENKLPNVFD